jgi:hypothetical protein
MPGLLHIETRSGIPVMAHKLRLLPFAQRVSLRLPVFNLGLVWNRPVSVLVTDADGREQVLVVPDPTRQIMWTLYAAVGLLAIFALFSKLQRGTK